MWYSDQTYTPEEIQVLKELEYDLFMFNPGFRSQWNNNFEAYFKALFNKEAWEESQTKSLNRWEDRMQQDPEMRAFLQRQHLIDEVLFGDLDIKNVPIDVRQEIEEIYRESKEADEQVELYERLGVNAFEEAENEAEDTLYEKAQEWQAGMTKVFTNFHEATKHTDAFRILVNHALVAAKIYSVVDDFDETEIDYEWRPDRINYTLALTSLNRCIESMENLRGFPQVETVIDAHLPLAREIRQELIDRLENIARLHLLRRQSSN
jgi:hypothetical protein